MNTLRRIAIPVVVVAVCALAGTYIFQRSQAATASVSAEAESGTTSGTATRVTDSTASGSSAVKFITAPTPPVSSAAYPRLAGMLIGGHGYDQASYQQQIAKLDLAILGMYNLWNSGGKTPAQAVNEIKARNPKILLGNYTLMTEVYTSTSDSATADLRAKLNAEKGPNGVGDWWGYNAAGQKMNWSGGTYPVNDTNLTLQTTPDSNGDRFPQWKNNLFVGSLAQQKFLRFVVEKGKVVHREEIFERLGRVRDIKTGPDGLLYLALEFIGKPGRVVRLVPAK